MHSTEPTKRQRTPLLVLTSRLAILTLTVSATLAGCASDRLIAAAPSGVNLSGDWSFDQNLSDDPDKILEQDKSPPPKQDTTPHPRGGGRGTGGGVPPIGPTDGPTSRFAPNTGAAQTPSQRETALSGDWTGPLPQGALAPGIEQSNPLPPADSPPSDRHTTLGRLLQAPEVLQIIQSGQKITIRTKMPDGTITSDDYVSGFEGQVTYGKDTTAQRRVGWRGSVFVITTKAKNGWREDDYALDEDGRLIFTSDIKAGRIRQFEIKRVYDRMKT